MKNVQRFPNLLDWLDNHNIYLIAQCYTITIQSPTVQTFYLTSCDIDITYPDINGVPRTFLHCRDNESFPIIKRGDFTVMKGTEASEMELTLLCGANARIPGVEIPIPLFCLNGGFDGATVLLEWAYMGQSGWGTENVIGAVPMFSGKVSEATPSSTQVSLKVFSEVELLNATQIPKHIFEVQCQNVLGDANCGVDVPALTETSQVYGTPTQFQFMSTLTKPNGYFNMGIVTFTTGNLTGVKIACRTYTQSNGVVVLATPAPETPHVGDQFTITPGCDKQCATCQAKFNNKHRYRGYPYIPQPEQALR